MESRYSSYTNLSGTCGSVCKKRPQQCLYALCSSPASKIPSTLLMNSPNFAAATEFQFYLEKTTTCKGPSAILPVISSIKDYLANMFKSSVNMDSTAINSLEKPAPTTTNSNKFLQMENQTKSILASADFSALASLLDRDPTLEPWLSKTTNCCSTEMYEKDVLRLFDVNNENVLKIIEAIRLMNQQKQNTMSEQPDTVEEEESFEVITYPMEVKPKSQKKRRKNRRSKKKKDHKNTKVDSNNPVGCKKMENANPAACKAPKDTRTSSVAMEKTTKPSTSWTFVEKCHNNKHDWMILPKDNFSFELKRSLACDNYSSAFRRQRGLSECSDDFICFELESDVDETDNFSKNTIVTSGYDSDSDFDENDNRSDSDDAKKVRFSGKLQVHVIHAWNFAYRQARKGHWEQIALDRVRFENRIRNLKTILNPVLSLEHRRKIFNERFNNDG